MPSNCKNRDSASTSPSAKSTPSTGLRSFTHIASPAGRRVGERVRQICQVLEDIGPSGRASIGDRLPDIEASNLGKYCARAVAMGLLSVEPGLGHKANYSVYSVAANWRELADKRSARITVAAGLEAQRDAAAAATPKTRWSGISSIFQLGARQTS